MASKYSSEYTPTNGSPIHDGYIIVGETLFEVDETRVTKKYHLSGDTPAELAHNARRKAQLDNSEIVYYDNEDIYYEDDLYKGKFLLTEGEIEVMTPDDEEDEEGYNDICEHFFDD